MSPRSFHRLILFALAVLVLTSCATKRSALLPELTDWKTRQAVLTSIEHWEFKGRVGVSAGDEGFNGKLNWVQKADRFQASVSGPLGIGTVKLDGVGESVNLTDRKGVVTRLEDAERDLQLRYGWTIPVKSLRYWALGIPDPSIPAVTEFAADGSLSKLRQAGWQVVVRQYREGGGQTMPRRLVAENESSKVRLVIDRWLFY